MKKKTTICEDWFWPKKTSLFELQYLLLHSICLASIPQEAAVAMAQRSDLVLLPSIRRPDEDEVRGIGGSEEPYSLDTDLMVPWRPVRCQKQKTKKHTQNWSCDIFVGVSLIAIMYVKYNCIYIIYIILHSCPWLIQQLVGDIIWISNLPQVSPAWSWFDAAHVLS